MKYIIATNPCSFHNTYLHSQQVRVLPLSVTFKQAGEKLADCSMAPSITPASTLLTSHKSQPPRRLQSHTYRRVGGLASGAGWLASSEVTSSSTTSPSSPCTYMVWAALLHTWRAPADGWPDRQPDRPAGRAESCELDKPSSRAAPPVLQWLWLAAWERDLGSTLGGKLVPNPEVYSLVREVIRNSCMARWFILMF